MKNSIMTTKFDGITIYWKIGIMHEKVYIKIDGCMYVEGTGIVPGLTIVTGHFLQGTERHQPVYGDMWETLGESVAPGMGMCYAPPIPTPKQVREEFKSESNSAL